MTEPVSPPMSLMPPMPKRAAELSQAERAHEITELRQHPAFFDSVHDPARHQQVVARHSELILAEEATPPVAPPDPGSEVPATPAAYHLGLGESPRSDKWSHEDGEALSTAAHNLNLTHREAYNVRVFLDGNMEMFQVAFERDDDEKAAKVWVAQGKAIGLSDEEINGLWVAFCDHYGAVRSGRSQRTPLDLQKDANWFRSKR